MFTESDLLRFVEGDCSPAEAAAMQAWIAADPRRAAVLDELQAVWRLTGDATRRWDVAAARGRVRDARPGVPPRLYIVPDRARPAGPFSASPWLLRIAAAVILSLASALLWTRRPHPPPSREFATGPGQRAELSLPDGSRILLSVATRLRLPRDFGAHQRSVELDGEAYFVVRHDPAHPFVVRTPYGTAEDLGTEFDVHAYGHEDGVQVVVAKGSVALRAPSAAGTSRLNLRARDRGVIDARGRATRTSGVRLDNFVAWTRGSLVFEDAPLPRVLAELARWYDLDVATADRSLDDERVTIAFSSASADDALSALARVLNVRFTRTGRAVRLLPIVHDHRRPGDAARGGQRDRGGDVVLGDHR